MSSNNYAGPRLPSVLLTRVNGGAQPNRGGGANRGGRNAPKSRKEERKVERQQKKTHQRAHRPVYNAQSRPPVEASSDDEDGNEGEDDTSPPPPSVAKPPTTLTSDAGTKGPKSILKQASPNTGGAKAARAPSPVRPPAVSKRIKEKLAEDDDEILALEKRLGIKSGKRGKAFEEDGLNDLLEGLDGDDAVALDGSKRKRPEDQEWLENKRRRVAEQDEEDSDENSDDDEIDSDSDVAEDDFEGFNSECEVTNGDEDADASDLDDKEADAVETRKKPKANGLQQTNARENPYVAPQVGPATSGKYVPPSLRVAAGNDAELAQRLRRQAQGLLNRLSEANLLAILGDVEKLYQNNPRQYVTSTLIDLLIGLIRDRTTLQDTFIILHASFISGLYKLTGSDFGAQMIEEIVQQFDKAYAEQQQQPQGESGKEALNLMSLLAQLYNLQVIGSNLVFDYLRTFLGSLSELHTELLLRIIRSSGHQLRTDDPSSLKDIVTTLHSTVAAPSPTATAPSVRTKFMIESINDLKNNKTKSSSGATSAMTSEHLIRMKKALGTLNTRAAGLKATEPLRIGLSDIRDTSKIGKWWLVGASWRGEPTPAVPAASTPTTTTTTTADAGEPDLLALAKSLRLNTTIRRSIFLAVMSASDYTDASQRLLKLQLSAAQRAEVPRVLLHCCAAEAVYNPYYTLVARAVCGAAAAGSARAGHVMRVGLQRALWDRVPGLGLREVEAEDDDDDGEGGLAEAGLVGTVNLAKMFGNLVAQGVLGLDYVLKNVEWMAYEGDGMAARTRAFLQVMLVTFLVRCRGGAREGARKEGKAESLVGVLGSAREFAPGLLRFLRDVVGKSDLVASEREGRRLREACKEAKRLLTSRGGRMEIDDVVDWGDK